MEEENQGGPGGSCGKMAAKMEAYSCSNKADVVNKKTVNKLLMFGNMINSKSTQRISTE